jgi:hypothetical protein
MQNGMPVPYAEWRPDVALVDNEYASVAENAFPGLNSYLPFPGFATQTTTALPAQCRGLYAAKTTAGNWKIIGGTATRLYNFNFGTRVWDDISRLAGGNYSLVDGDLWRFQDNGTKVFAVHPNDDMQVLDVDSGSNFALAPGAPPRAQHVAQVGPFLVLSGLTSNKRKLQWSAIEDPGGWSAGTNLSDIQETPEGGNVQGVAGGEIGYIVQERAIRTLQYLPGDTQFIFAITRVVQDRGCVSKYGFTVVSGILYFVAEDGIFALAGQQLLPIGETRVNDWFLRNSDPARRNLVLAFNFQHAHRVAWAFHNASTSIYYDRLLIYDWALQKFSYAIITAQMWAALATGNLDLDTTGTDPGDAFLDSNAPSLDSYSYTGGRPVVGGIDQNGILSFLTGANLAATLETAERHLAPGMRAFVNEVYPLDDAASDAPGTIAVGSRERLQGALFWTPPVPVEQTTGSAYPAVSARVMRFRRSIPALSTWTHAQGVLVDAQKDGTIA